MIRSLIFTAIRNLVKNPFFSFINIFGLSAGLSAFLLLFLYVYNEITYDRFNKKEKRIYRLCENQLEYTKGLAVPYIMENFPEVENATRVLDWSSHRFTYEQKELKDNITCADTGFFHIFSFKFIEGNPDLALKNKYGVVLTKNIASRLFGEEPALNKIINVDYGSFQLTVTGVVDEIPDNSSIKFDLIVNNQTGFELDPWLKDIHDWYNTFSQSYVLVRQNTDIKALEHKFIPFVEEKFLTGEQQKPELNLLPLAELHNYTTNNQSFTYLLLCIAAGIALIACINFIHLFTAASSSRIKEIGIRKTMGATRKQLFLLFFGEALVISFLAIIAGIFLSFMLLPFYNNLFHAHLEMDLVGNPFLIPIIAVFWLLTGTLSGFVPAIRLSNISTIASIKGMALISRNKFRNAFAIFQFMITIFLIIGALTIRKQISFMKNHSLNFDSENVVVLKTDLDDYRDQDAARQKVNAIVDALKADSRVASVTVSNNVPGTYQENYNNFYTDGWSQKESVSLRQVYIGPEYFKTYGIRFLEGDYSNEEHIVDSNLVVINHAALKQLGAESGLNNILYASSRNGQPYKIIGVVEDYFYQGLHRNIQPLIHFYSPHISEDPEYISVRIKAGQIPEALAMLKKQWKEIPPAKELNYFFADDAINKQYEFVTQTSSLAGFFSILAMILSCLGLLAMLMFIINRRIKEIGIRKAVGATAGNILQLFSFQYTKWIALSFVIASPVAFYAMNKWLQNFAYKTEISWWIFILSGSMAFITALIVVCTQTLKAALANPVNALKYE